MLERYAGLYVTVHSITRIVKIKRLLQLKVILIHNFNNTKKKEVHLIKFAKESRRCFCKIC